MTDEERMNVLSKLSDAFQTIGAGWIVDQVTEQIRAGKFQKLEDESKLLGLNPRALNRKKFSIVEEYLTCSPEGVQG